ncbi:MAG: ribonuclease catalytic domain-containing protein [Treponema sp.]|uniref:ribonuclease catalytic domain-containing protein n=1 Tax=Treponema sp. TaxID=166 RepID=UPI003FA29058
MKKNNLVLYKNQPALITDVQIDKFEITLESGTKRVRGKDIVPLHPGECRSLKAALEASVPPVDFAEAAEFFAGEAPSFAELTELLWGNYAAEQSWQCWQALCASPYFICTTPAEPIGIRTQEEIERLQQKQTEKEQTEKLRRVFIDALHACMQGASFPADMAGAVPFFQEIEALALGSASVSKLLKEAKIEQTPEQAHEVLLKTGFWQIERNPYPSRFGHSLHSSKVDIPAPVQPKDVLDLTAVPAYAIDNPGSTDPDDAVSFDGTYLWIHIANPADTIQADTQSDKDACARGATLYTPEGASRMLGEQAVDYFALGLKPDSYALSFKLLLDADGAIQEVSIHRTKLSVIRLTYEEADRQKDTPALAPLFAIAERNRIRRDDAGAVTIDFPEVTIRLEEQDGKKLADVRPAVPTEAAAMIKEMMLLAGEAAARFAFRHSIPFQYISQESPELPASLPPGLAGEYKKRRAMRPRSVGTIPAMHAALGLAMYGQVTSPLRRYGDLVSHRQLLNFIDGKPLTPADELILKIAAGDEAGRACVAASRASRQHWTLVYLLQHPEWQGRAVVLDTMGKKAHIFIPSIGYEGDINLNAEAELNQEFTVKVRRIRLPYLQAVFEQVC